jgi:purine nucleoside permease
MAPIDMMLLSSFADRLPIQVVVVTAMHVELRTWIERFPLGETLRRVVALKRRAGHCRSIGIAVCSA